MLCLGRRLGRERLLRRYLFASGRLLDLGSKLADRVRCCPRCARCCPRRLACRLALLGLSPSLARHVVDHVGKVPGRHHPPGETGALGQLLDRALDALFGGATQLHGLVQDRVVELVNVSPYFLKESSLAELVVPLLGRELSAARSNLPRCHEGMPQYPQ